MKRELNRLTKQEFDVLIIGGGIHGAALAWRASIAGYSTALIEQNDFSSGTSSNSQKIIHGGLRYLQNLNFIRVRKSANERRRFMWLAPHLVSPLQCIMPIYGYKLKGKEVLSVAAKIYDFISVDRNSLSDESKHIGNTKLLNRSKINESIPGIDQEELRGGILWHDGFCNNTERLIISLIKSAVAAGGVAANYLKAENLVFEDNKVTAIEVFDKLHQKYFRIRAKTTIACTGSESNRFNSEAPKQKCIAGVNIVVKKLFKHDFAVGIENNKNNRLYFIVPWGDKSILGTEWYLVSDADKFQLEKQHIERLIENFNNTYPAANLTYNDVQFVYKGVVPAIDNPKFPTDILSQSKYVSGANFGSDGFYQLVGVKYTTAISDAENMLKFIFPEFRKIRLKLQPKLVGGEIDNLEQFKQNIYIKYDEFYSEQQLHKLIINYGNEIDKVINLHRLVNESDKLENENNLLKSMVLFAIREEMAFQMEDLVLRRTDIGSFGEPSPDTLEFISQVMAKELSWNEAKRVEEIQGVKNYYSLLSKNLLYNHTFFQ